jgi:hypothetical protein
MFGDVHNGNMKTPLDMPFIDACTCFHPSLPA